MAEKVTRAVRAARGVLFVHSSPRALCPHVEWAAGRALGTAVNFDWSEQPVYRGLLRAEFTWEGEAGTGAKLASALRGWDQLRFEVSEDPTPETDTAGNTVIPEDRIRYAMEVAGHDAVELHRELRLALGQAWDDELEPFRHASDFAPVVWLHQVG